MDVERERRRLAALHEYHLLDAPADDELEAVVRVAAAVAGVPTATLNLIDEHRQCQLTTVGFPGADSPRSDSMCAIRFEAGEFMYTPDASRDPTYRTNPWVTGDRAGVRLYGSAPLITPDGYALGSLCVFHDEPGTLDAVQVARLRDLASVILALFERRRQARINRELAVIAEARQRWTDTLLETIDVAVVAADQSGRLTVFNRAAREWHGLDADPTLDPHEFADRYQLYTTDGVTLLPPAQLPLLRALRDGTVENAELIIKRSGATPIHATVSGRALVAPDGTPMGAVVAMTDVTSDRAQQRAIEAARRELAAANAELRRSNTELTNFAGAVSHDLVAPLSAVRGYLELLENEVTGEHRTWVDACCRAVNRMRDLIDSLLQYAQAGSAPIRRVPADLGRIADEVLADLQPAVDEASAEVTVPAPLPEVSCDPVLARQLLQNLIANAIKYRHPSRPCRVTVTAARADAGWSITVADNGIGIPPDKRRRVFDMFTRLDDTPGGGHGIGLSSCLRIVDRHGGAIRVEENPGGGTCVIFSLPD
ncbi:putative multi-sensor signal transduction histidine kinase [Actinoplanes missouriensis 431]|uniref:Sensor-like histidine kinase SenX3 n=1 Tax=Actinoplanes missouriensis (strain ATCC 14538 / DSM 43046 / CBS 188.64 / JCM 3121 / NBRC 102363 / NCIMB 12654 / NRRL B-3342 / UNCC 431) TaxID=512565 RepID=I0H6H1_ACTM4|nr:ATP-binding protein [Actinoplanes missouriensis]BAL88608.1 putative multi-sensor signal transduction histidine kinase [Actinoplanes missouriensis 431]